MAYETANRNDETERNAYNAAFHELGFRWHWDSETYRDLTSRSSNAAEQINHYLQTRHPHLLKAYEAASLAEVIEDKKAKHATPGSMTNGAGHRHFNWAEILGCELGA